MVFYTIECSTIVDFMILTLSLSIYIYIYISIVLSASRKRPSGDCVMAERTGPATEPRHSDRCTASACDWEG